MDKQEPYWFKDMSETIFNIDLAFKILPTYDMTYPQKINSLVRLSLYIGVVVGLLTSNYLYLYIPIVVMLLTYILYLFRKQELQSELQKISPNAKLEDLPLELRKKLAKNNMLGTEQKSSMTDILNIKECSRPNENNPFMNPLLFDSRLKPQACNPVDNNNQYKIESEYNKYCIKDASDIFNHNSGRRQFYTVASTTYPNNQTAFANWLYKVPPTCKESSGAQCIANLPNRLNSSLISPSFAQ